MTRDDKQIISRLSPEDGAHLDLFFNQFGFGQFATGWSQSALSQDAYLGLSIRSQNGDIAAAIICRISADEAEIIEIAVADTYRRRNFAGDLLLALQEELSCQNVARVVLEVAETNEPARLLYQKYGFIACGHRANYYDNHIGAIIMELWLSKV